ncbi:MAG: transaldolase [Gammaproteobacteria bacterium]|nr:transaldolase [Gammaproteobacteria bacterium]
MNATAQPVSSPLQALAALGQSVWLDYIKRDLILDGGLQRLVDEGITGLTSNPSIFEKAIAAGGEYDDLIRPLRTAARDGYVSLEVSPHLAHDTQGTVAEARRLWGEVDRPNLMIKVPATGEGMPAIRRLIADGINVNVTLLFALDAYEQAALAYIEGLEERARAGGALGGVASVASVFVSRIDTAVDARLTGDAAALAGKAAIANTKLVYQRYLALFSGPRWDALAARGARTQRPLWGSTGTKNPAYSDVLYVDELIGPDTVNTLPPATLDAFREHGRPRASLAEDVDGARRLLAALQAAGIDMSAVTDQLLAEGVKLFADAFDKLLAAVARRSAGG